MKLSVTSWSFPALSLREIAGVARALGIEAIDVGLFYAAALDKARVLAAPEQAATELAELGVGLANLYWLFGSDVEERNLADPASLAANRADFERVVRFCAAAGIPTVMLLPGVINPGQGRGEAIEASAAALRELLPIAQAAGVALGVEPHVHSFAESPALALELLERAPGTQLVLDYAHFVCLGYTQSAIDPLAAHACHVHLRQARPGALQAKLHQGTINFAAVIATLRSVGYAGHLALEYVHQDYMGTLYDDVLTETVRTRDLARRFL